MIPLVKKKKKTKYKAKQHITDKHLDDRTITKGKEG